MIQNYVKITLRNLRKNPLTTGLNVAGLAAGIAVCLFVGVWMQRELSFDNFHPDVDRIFRIVNTFKSESESFSQAPSGPALGARLPAELPEIEAGCRYLDGSDRLSVADKHFFEDDIIIADSNFFQFFHFPLLKGDPARALADMSGIVLTESMAKKYFGDADPMGQTLTYGARSLLKVSGIAADPPVNSQIQFTAVMPMPFLHHWAAENWGDFKIDDQWLGGWMYTFICLRDAAEWKDAERHVNAAVEKHSKKDWDENKMKYTYALQPMRDIHLHSNLRYDVPSNGSMARVWMFGTVGLVVLLLACINYMNLATAGALKRAKETGVRKVVGARRSELIRQFLTDSILLSLLATALGVLLFQLFLPAFSTLTGQPYSLELSPGNIGLLAGFGLLTGVVSGLYPAFVLSSFKPATTLKGAFQHTPRGGWLRKGLVVFQFASTAALLVGILVIRQQMAFVQSKGLGYQGDAVLEVNYRGATKVDRGYGALRNELLQEPSIKNVSMHTRNVVGGVGNGWTTTEDLNGQEISTSAYAFEADPDYFDTYGMQLAAGRFFSKDNPTDTAKAILVNEAAVRTFGWQKAENAIGKRFGKGADEKRVIGVVKDFHFESLHKPVEALVIHFARGGVRVSLRIDQANAKTAIHHLESSWKKMFPDIPLDYAFVDEKVAKLYGNERTAETLFLLFSGLSLFIACLGLFGLIYFAVQQRTKEIGIRKVLGASVAGIVGLLSKEFLILVAASLLIAAPVAWYVMQRWLQGFAYRVEIPLWAFLAAGLISVGVAFLTLSWQSIKAARVNPARSLRSE